MPLQRAPMVRRGSASIKLGVLDARLGYFIRRVQLWVFQDFIRALSGLDLSPAQFSVVAVVAANPGLTQAALSETLGIERARLARMLHDLGRRDITQRLPSARDKRSHALHLTGEGQKLFARARALSAKHEERLVKRFGTNRYNSVLAALRDF
ncbi:MAG: MarR family transcriptional regulator [Pseudolabrys sp.]|nr:MarR family transcriptional regulator [Pseudolabrys sp.]MBV9956699.1 MarR family transcriptional regulator [Pseudolabrys sp.]